MEKFNRVISFFFKIYLIISILIHKQFKLLKYFLNFNFKSNSFILELIKNFAPS